MERRRHGPHALPELSSDPSLPPEPPQHQPSRCHPWISPKARPLCCHHLQPLYPDFLPGVPGSLPRCSSVRPYSSPVTSLSPSTQVCSGFNRNYAIFISSSASVSLFSHIHTHRRSPTQRAFADGVPDISRHILDDANSSCHFPSSPRLRLAAAAAAARR